MKTPPEARPSATILLVRDGARGLEVFMVQRHHQIDFATGAMVFPGGKVEPADADPALAALCDGAASDALRPIHVAAIRETFEECGVLLARPLGDSALVPGARLAQIEQRHRAALNAGERTLREVVEQEQLRLANDLLVHFAHWITPLFMPKRFDTHFYLVAAPADQLAVHDGGESVDSVWTRPEDAEAERAAGRRTIIFPTLMQVRKLGRSGDVATALRTARSQPVVSVLPRVEDRDGEKMLVIPAEAGYDVTSAPLAELQ
ncbi:MAG TPA: NUDIX hydrolase [Myxococcota bacterium]|jgi:8-oxo-dGTP pyrophosphatase MutT (NUDIX family)